jgi:FlaA1/EpsC-like NDP-sugar epimerase
MKLQTRLGTGRLGWARRYRTFVASAVYSVIAGLGLAVAYLARFEFDWSSILRAEFVQVLCVLVVVRLGVNYSLRLPIGRWRYVASRDFVRLIVAQSIGSALFFALLVSIPILPAVPRSVIVLEWMMGGYGTMIVWVLYRLAFERSQVRRAGPRKRVLLVGAGEGGEVVVSQMLRSTAGYQPVGLVDDDALKWGTSLHGVKVLGPTSRIGAVASDLEAEEIVIGIPSVDTDALRRIVEACEGTGLPIKILSGIKEVLEGTAVGSSNIRDIKVEDLLGRDPVRLELPALAEQLAGKTVLVTGAAGSIGSGLVRQLALHSPKCLILLDQAETPLFYLELEVLRREPAFRVVSIVGSVTDLDTVNRVVAEFRPDRVFHAAAYKHVPMMEHNREEAVRTNVLGTFQIASAAAAGGAEAFILVSTDKAVRPANVMGATKQMAERVVLNLQGVYPQCSFGAVRFGNVLGSSGSVIPVFRRQLARREPLTVTDRDVTRYFMTIPEAVQLILQASLVPDLRGHVAMLDMGEPVRILDLARDLLRLSGQPFRPGENVVITGLRPGEKLHEELSAPDELVVRTELDRVSIVQMTNDFALLPVDLAQALERGDLDAVADHVLGSLIEPAGIVSNRPVGLPVF